MSSTKPDKELIKRIVRERYGWERPANIFEPMQSAALTKISDGAMTLERARQLDGFLEFNPHIASIFPNNALLKALRSALEPGGWTSQAEHDLLIFIAATYSNDQPFEGWPYQLKTPLPLFGDLYPLIFNTPTEPVSLAGKLCGFTGSFTCGSRAQCFERVLAAGGTPSDGGWYTDYFFVADKHIDAQAISNGLSDALRHRQAFGVMQILPESYFPA